MAFAFGTSVNQKMQCIGRLKKENLDRFHSALYHQLDTHQLNNKQPSSFIEPKCKQMLLGIKAHQKCPKAKVNKTCWAGKVVVSGGGVVGQLGKFVWLTTNFCNRQSFATVFVYFGY